MASDTLTPDEIAARLSAVEEAVIALASGEANGEKFAELLRLKIAWCVEHVRPEPEGAAHRRLLALFNASRGPDHGREVASDPARMRASPAPGNHAASER